MISEKRSISYTQYRMWMECPYQWKLKYVDKIRVVDNSIELVFGTAMHTTIQKWLDIRFTNKKLSIKFDLHDPFKDELLAEFTKVITVVNEKKVFVCDSDTLMEYYEDGCEILTHLQKYADEFFPTEHHKLLGCEIPIKLDIDRNLTFVGFLDIVVHDTKENKYHIIDLKTSKKGWYRYQKTDEKKTHQLLLYKTFYAKQYNVSEEDILPKFIILKRKIAELSQYPIKRLSNFEPSHGTVSMKKTHRSFTKFITECFDEMGSPTPDDLKPTPSDSACRFCVYNKNAEWCSVSAYLNKE